MILNFLEDRALIRGGECKVGFSLERPSHRRVGARLAAVNLLQLYLLGSKNASFLCYNVSAAKGSGVPLCASVPRDVQFI